MVASRQWDKWVAVAARATRKAVREWFLHSSVKGGVVQAVAGELTPGSLNRMCHLGRVMQRAMLEGGVSREVAASISDVVEEAWNAWFAGYHVRLSFPTLGAVPAPFAPSTRALPQRVSTGRSSSAGICTASELSRKIVEKLGPSPEYREASDAIRRYADWLARCFRTWRSKAVLRNVSGSGPVPTFAPPYSPVGPCVQGSLQSMTPVLHDGGAFDSLP